MTVVPHTYQKLVPEEQSRFMAPVSGVCAMGLTVVCYVDSSSESDDTDDNFYSMSDARRRNAGHQWQDRIQRQSRLCVTLSISKGRVLACTASQVYIAVP